MQFRRKNKRTRKNTRKTVVETSEETVVEPTTHEALSIGWNCNSAVVGVSTGLRSKRCNGYKTCPFDTMFTNYGGVVQCFEDDFKYFCDTEYLQIIQMPSTCQHFSTNGEGNMLIYNTKYNFLFNHESPHKDHYINECWEKGINHFVMNNYEEFINRYSRRIRNVRELLKSGKHITFILTRPETDLVDIPELVHVIKSKYPSLEFDFKFIDFDKAFYHEFLLLMKFDKEDEEVKRLA